MCVIDDFLASHFFPFGGCHAKTMKIVGKQSSERNQPNRNGGLRDKHGSGDRDGGDGDQTQVIMMGMGMGMEWAMAHES